MRGLISLIFILSFLLIKSYGFKNIFKQKICNNYKSNMRHNKIFLFKKNEKHHQINDMQKSKLTLISSSSNFINTQLYSASGSFGHLMDDNNNDDEEYEYDNKNKNQNELNDINSNSNCNSNNNNNIDNDGNSYFDDNEIYEFKEAKKKPLVTVKKKKPFSGPWPYEFTFVEDILPDPTQGKSWIINFIIDALKIAWRIKETLFEFMDP